MEYEQVNLVWSVISIRQSQSYYTVIEKYFDIFDDAVKYVEHCKENKAEHHITYSIEPCRIERIKQ